MNTADKIREIEKKHHFQSDWFEEALQEMAEWKDEQHSKEKQQWIDKAMKVICDGCAQKVECEFNNWKTCSRKDELIKAMEEQL